MCPASALLGWQQPTLHTANPTTPLPTATQPALLKQLGQAEEVTRLLGPYLLALLPAVWVDAFYR